MDAHWANGSNISARKTRAKIITVGTPPFRLQKNQIFDCRERSLCVSAAADSIANIDGTVKILLDRGESGHQLAPVAAIGVCHHELTRLHLGHGFGLVAVMQDIVCELDLHLA